MNTTILRITVAALTTIAAGTAGAQDAIVPDDFGTIQAAVQVAADNDGSGMIDILVRAGVYVEDVFIRRDNIALAGEDANTTMIQGSGLRNTVDAERVSNLSISGFTVVSGGQFDSIDIDRVTGGSVEGNILTGGGSGVSVDRSTLVTVADNEVFGTTLEAINLDRCARITVSNNAVHDNQGEGIAVDNCRRSRIDFNLVTDNGSNGIRDRASSNNLYLRNESLRNVDNGFLVEESTGGRLVLNTGSGNVDNGLRMRDTSDHLITGNAFTGNLNYGVRRENWLNDDFDRSQAGVQNPPGDNDLSGNVNGPLRED